MDSGRTLPADVERELFDELLESKRLIEGLTNVVTDGVIQLDAARRIARFNQAAERMLGYSSASVIGSGIETLLAERGGEELLGATPPREPVAGRVVFRDSSGHALPVQGRVLALGRQDSPEGWILSFARARRIDEIEQLKNELVSTVSHELKTPLSAIKAYTATLRHNPALYESHREEFLGVVEQQADRLARLIDDMLMVARVETDQLMRKRVRVPLDPIVDQALRDVHYDPSLHFIERSCGNAEISGDPERIRDIFRNLLENAVKYSPEGGAIRISAEQTESATIVEIRDRGIGIDEEHLPYIFDRFFRVESPVTASAGGSGLGLYIVNALVRAHGASIAVHSTPGEGTTFVLRFPLR